MSRERTIIEPIQPENNAGRWTPRVGNETLDFLRHAVPEGARANLQTSAVEILSKGVPPTHPSGQETGLILGYVQSGKTMSFETVTTLAHDNGFQLVIVIAGVATNLLGQSTGRLTEDLRLDSPGRARRWVQFENPENDDTTAQAIRDVLDEWRDPETLEDHKRTVLVTVLKRYNRINNLTNLLRTLNLANVPVLIIDDEADQASMNTEASQGQESTTYRHLLALRQVLPNHTYLQYTATPQAPLLISIADALSPNFIQVLEPGEDYVGGREFFDGNQTYIRVIPPEEVPTNANPLNEPPETLLEALRIFMVGVTIGFMESNNTGNRSMLAHPSHRTTQHQEFYGWVRDIFDEWKRILELRDTEQDKQELIEDLREAYEDLSETVEQLPPFEQIIPRFRSAFRNTRVLEVNARSGNTPSVDWRSAYGWILVGGQAMDRGFTVEGLTVTYMPRGIGVGNADTVQQRARFFGYKRRYLGYCRVYLEQGTLDAFQDYVEHEEDVRNQLIPFQDSLRPLNEWKRAFLLEAGLRPCRDNVLAFDYMRGRYSEDWVSPRVVLSSNEVHESNRTAVQTFCRILTFSPNDGHENRTDTQRHSVCANVPLSVVMEQLLIPTRITGITDSQRHTGLLLQMRKALEQNPDEVCTIYIMSPNVRRQRGVDEDGEVTNLFQGEFPVHPREQRGDIYPGDRAIRDNDNITIQLHTLDLTRDNNIIAREVPVAAVWVPARFARTWLIQHQPGQ